ncbi:indole-3-glycerol phosphate synthase [Striga asiatica]|uniref:Indole-3-glycerol phosphate synthase n=1 Tax=Striga asiatica TaxID=4170 RepID=A0A5A7Q2Q9_STRAF|nr:indole-3-glycerol phosphate synthase [Striga asiatica]
MHRCQAEYQLQLLMEEDFWKQKATVRWVAEGERNTRFFQGFVRQKHAKSYIHSIEADGSSLTQESQIRESAVAHFQTLFTSDRWSLVAPTIKIGFKSNMNFTQDSCTPSLCRLILNFVSSNIYPSRYRKKDNLTQLLAAFRFLRTLPGTSRPRSITPSASLHASATRPALHKTFIISSKAVSSTIPIGASSSKILQALATLPERQSPVEMARKQAAVGVTPLSIITCQNFNASSLRCSLNKLLISIVNSNHCSASSNLPFLHRLFTITPYVTGSGSKPSLCILWKSPMAVSKFPFLAYASIKASQAKIDVPLGITSLHQSQESNLVRPHTPCLHILKFFDSHFNITRFTIPFDHGVIRDDIRLDFAIFHKLKNLVSRLYVH